MNYSEYVALGWRVLINFGTETLAHTGSINGWNAFVGFTPTKQDGVVLLCSCDSRDVDMSSLGFVLLHLSGTENMTAKMMLFEILQAYSPQYSTIISNLYYNLSQHFWV